MDASSSFSVGQGSLHFVRGRSFLWARGGLEAALPPCVRRKPLRTRVAHVRGVLLGGSRHRVLTGDDPSHVEWALRVCVVCFRVHMCKPGRCLLFILRYR